ncbi:MAG: hypothetical protein WCI39_03285 [Gallionellaceae bacterium]
MSHAKLFTTLVITAFILYALAGFYLLPLANFEGGLTRLGKLPESLFGWNKSQPVISPQLFSQADWQDADVLVIGDSFSVGDATSSNTRPYLWQTVLVQSGLKVHTEGWGNIRAICTDFIPWVQSKGFEGKYIVLENVERAAESNLDKSIACQKMNYKNTPPLLPTPPDVKADRSRISYSGKLSVGIETWLHQLTYLYLSERPDFKQQELSNHVKIQRMSDGCDLFSHPRCQDVLFFTEDRIEDFDENMFSKMSQIESRLVGLVPVWVIVPDKTTVYLNSNKQFWNTAEQRFRAPNLLKTFRNEIQNKTVDFYRGNDTHLSTEGFLVMGRSISVHFESKALPPLVSRK